MRLYNENKKEQLCANNKTGNLERVVRMQRNAWIIIMLIPQDYRAGVGSCVNQQHNCICVQLLQHLLLWTLKISWILVGTGK